MFEKRIVLVPFTDADAVEAMWQTAIQKAQKDQAEIVWLRVIEASYDEECLFSELKGLQARLCHHEIVMHLHVEYGNLTEAISNYRKTEHQADLLILPS